METKELSKSASSDIKNVERRKKYDLRVVALTHHILYLPAESLLSTEPSRFVVVLVMSIAFISLFSLKTERK